MAEENLGLDLASQTGQENIVEAINGLKNLLQSGFIKTSEVDLISHIITQNGSYNPFLNNEAYKSIEVNVPNTYTAEDEGKVVHNGILVDGGTSDTYILSGINEPSSDIGNNGDIFLQYTDLSNINFVSYLRTNNNVLDISLSNWLYRTSDKVVLKYKNVGTHSGNWGQFIKILSNINVLGIQYNMYSGRNVMNVWHGGSYSGDSYYSFDGPNNLSKVYTIILDGSNFVIISDENGVQTEEVNTNIGNVSDIDVDHPTLFPTSGNSLNVEFYSFEVYRNNKLIHNYVPIQGGLIDIYDGNQFLIQNSGVTYGESVSKDYNAKLISSAYCKVDGNWVNLLGTNIDNVNGVQQTTQ